MTLGTNGPIGVEAENLIPTMGFPSQKSMKLVVGADLSLQNYQSVQVNGNAGREGGGDDQMLRQSMDGGLAGIVMGRKNHVANFIESDGDGSSPGDVDFSKARNRITTHDLASPGMAPKMNPFREEMTHIEKGLSERSVGSAKRSSAEKKHKTLSSKDNPLDSAAKRNFSPDQ